MRHSTLRPASQAFFRQLPWWLAGLAFSVLGVMASAAWRAADDQRRDAEGAQRQLAAEAASQAGLRLKALQETAARPLLLVRPRWFTGAGAGEGADWVFGPWPQAESPAGRAFEEAQALFRTGKTEQAARLLEESFPEIVRLRKLALPSAAEGAETQNPAPARKTSHDGGSPTLFTASGLPLLPMIRRLELLILETTAHDSHAKSERHGNNAKNQRCPY